MDLKKYDRGEFLLTVSFSLATLADVVFIIRGHEARQWLEASHQVIESFMLLTFALFSSIMLLRWYRHHEEVVDRLRLQNNEVLNKSSLQHDEVLEKLSLQHDEVLEGLNISTHLIQHEEIATCLKEIVGDCSEIRKKGWPEYADLFLVRSLQRCKTEIGKLKAGQMTIGLEEAQSVSPDFFIATPGDSFVTAIGGWDYWTKPDGIRQLEANRKAIAENFGRIVRVFIIPKLDPPPQEIIKKQLEAGIDVRVAMFSSVASEFRRDVGVFFAGRREDKKVAFMSEWAKHSATLTFEGSPLIDVMRIHDYLMNKAHDIKSLGDWTGFATCNHLTSPSANPANDSGSAGIIAPPPATFTTSDGDALI